MKPMHFDQVAIVSKQSNPCFAARRRPNVRHLLALTCALAAVGCESAQPESPSPAVEVGVNEQALFANGDFESGPAGYVTPPNWTLTSYSNPSAGVTRQTPQTRAGLNLAAGGSLQTNTLYTASGAESQADAALGTGASLRWPKFGNYTVYMNSNPGSGNNINSLKQSMTLGVNDVDPYDGKPHIRFAVAPVLENPGHSAEQQPYYFVQVKNTTTGQVLYVDYNASAEPGIPWKISNGVYYTDWQLKDIAPTSTQATLGDSVELEVIAAGCSQGGHYGRVYVDGVGATIPGLSVTGTGPASANAGSDITYTLAFKNGGNGAAGNVTVEFNTPPNTTFQSVSAPGAICTQPTTGTTGLVSCIYGLVDPGVSDSLDVTVRIDPAATGTITAGNYQISANNASKLLGAKIYTSITSNISYADVTLTNSNGVGALNWNQAVTYRITASNAGPSALTGGTVNDVFPATLTNVSWTCSGTGGGTCAASGSGNTLNDTTVGLPVGGAVTYVVSATMAASGAATRVSDTATFTMPAGYSDPQPNDNADADIDPITTTYSLTINKAGTSTGQVVSVPNAINCTQACNSQSGTFASGAAMVLAATPTSGQVFAGWSGGGCSGTGNCSITLSANTVVTATFNTPPPCAADSDCSSTRYCDGATHTCLKRLANSTPIPNDGLHDGTCATGATTCVSQLCYANKCASHCTADSNCTADSYCNNTATFCTTKLPGGTAIPSDGLHGGTCTSASAVCASGLCNTTSVTCGNASGGTCSASSGCNSNNCKNGHCVPSASSCWADSDCSASQYCNRGTYTCTAKLAVGTAIPNDTLHTGTCSDAGAVCASGLCNTNNSSCAAANGAACTAASQCSSATCTSSYCVPANNGCYVDANCGAGNYCNRTTLTCTAKLTAGTAIPTDGLHGGTCASAAAVCVSGLCDSAANTCAQSDGASCTNANECVNNTCTSSHCVPAANGCYVDATCAAGNYCKRNTLTCTAKLAPGTAIPNDGLHGGTCSDAAAVCSSGQCNMSSSTCGGLNGGTCTNANQCATNTCTSSHCVPAGGCYVDGDCGAGTYCDRPTLTCVAKLGSGVSVPNDGLHDGTCTSAAAVCSTGLCDTTSNTCAQSNGASCTVANECTTHTCTTGRCVPAISGCYADATCGAGLFCNRTTLTCSTLLTAGTAIPNDGLHGGTCADAPIVCASGQCNTSTSTCGGLNGANCAVAGQCTTNTCTSGHCVPDTGGCYLDANCAQGKFCDRNLLMCVDKLGNGVSIPNDGLHGGTCIDANAVCATGLCDSAQNTCAQNNGASCSNANECTTNTCTSGHCVPAASGCYVDGDCSADKFCDRGTLSCVAKLNPGTQVPSDGLHDGTCTNATAVCQTGLCNDNGNGTSSCVASDGNTCSSGNQCLSRTCTSGHCVPDTNGCYIDGNCSSDKYCDRGALTCSTRKSQGTTIPASDGYHTGTCSDAAAVCQSGRCNVTSTTCGADPVAACTMASECASNVCDTNGKCGVKDGGAGCTSGTAATLCQSGTCVSSHCVPSGGSGCWVDSDCSSSQFCDRSTLLCASKLGNGTAIPNDGLHTGTCNTSSAQALCQSGGCNAVTNTCGAPNGSNCSAPEQCIRNVCGGNGKCGRENGAGPCTQANAKFVCQSATCSATANVCVAPSTQTCASDNDCAPQEYCDAFNTVCVPDLANGRPIPADVLHNGLCSANVAASVCVSGNCNASTQACAAALGASCTMAADCADNVCGSNGKCGSAPGQGPCTVQNQAATCQSGACSQNGTCLAAGGCSVDADCLPNGYCDGAAKTCATRLPPGSPLPNDGDHNGMCPGSGLSAACATGLCSTQSNRCVAPNITNCTTNEQCASGTCGGNGQCGVEDGAGPCTPGADPVCQSGSCGAGSTCDTAISCSTDAQCASAGAFCNDGACAPKLPTGAPIPNDGLHAATCNQGNATAVCVSGLCNANGATCAAARGSSCALPSQCAANVCGANGQCGLPNGAGPCTSGNAATVCQSGVCSSQGGTCIPSGGCSRDADCGAGDYCDGSMYMCVPKLSAGTPIPNESIHDGHCTQPNAAVCASAACNPVTNSCAAGNGGNCAGPAECAGNVCGGDGKCGQPDGVGPCSPAHPDVCRSGACSSTSLTCIPNGGCGSDNDCADSDYCDSVSHQCAGRKINGDAVPASINGGQCPDTGVTRSCASGQCDTTSDLCVARNGESCNDNTGCQSGVCGSNGQCGTEDGGNCTVGQGAQCQSGSCSDQGVCVTAAPCSADADCEPAGYCDGSTCRARRPSGAPLPQDSLHDGNCTDALAQLVCETGLCNDTSNTCAGELNAPCATGAACTANVCGADSKCGLAVGEGTCNNLNAAVRCRTQLCSAAGVCLPDLGSGCAADADCAAGKYCKRDTYECVNKLDDGAAIPSDGLHDGQCSEQVAALVCTSGACNEVTDTCARSNGTTCSNASTCINNVCGSNGLCGIAEGDGTCTADTVTQCQTARCSVSTGKCINVTLGCAADADCDETRYCAPGTRTCITKLGIGGKLPTDSLHNGTCSSSLATAVCQAAACNPQTNTCAASNGKSCSNANQCVSNVCGGNKLCGRNVGESGCQRSSQSLDCQSGYCADSGTCVPPSGCQLDGDCPQGSYCNRTAHACATKLAPGAPLPSDGLHAGTCDQTLAQAVCASGSCNPVTNTCAVTAATSCTQPEQCVTGVCADNEHCGLANGEGPCGNDAECQSGKCQPEVNVCVATSAGCTDDADCPTEQYCDRTHVQCVDDLDDGAHIPADSTSGGTCTADVAKVVCTSGACNPDNDTCARLGGADCDSDEQCAAGGCHDGKCGSPDGSGVCSADNASIACQSGECQLDLGRCVSLTNGCRADSDCGSGQYCDAKKLTCAAKLSSGTKLPVDEMHTDSCNATLASAVCDTGACNSKTNRCALAEGEVCAAAAECGSNACLSNVCVPTVKAPPAGSLSGGRCSVTQVGPSASSYWLLLVGLGLSLRLRRTLRKRSR